MAAMRLYSSAILALAYAPLSGLVRICSARHLAILWQNRHDWFMRQSFSRFAAVLLVLAVQAVARGQGPGFRVQREAVKGQEPGASGQELVAEAAKRVEREPAISAELRYRVAAYGHQLVGSGSYLQLGSGRDKLVKLTLRMPVGDQFATLVEIRGEDYYWLRRDVPPNPPTLERVNLRDFRLAVDQPGAAAPVEVMPARNWVALGGLPRLMLALEQNFAFEAPRADELQFNGNDGQSVRALPIWVVAGSWKPERLAIVGGKRTDARQAPEQLPDRVELILGRTDEILPLFPYRITYWQTPKEAAKADVSASESRELLTLELFNVHRKGDIDRREFHFNPGDQEVLDITAKTIQR